ncbi:hypothetical protein [Mesorhizobium sp. M0220]
MGKTLADLYRDLPLTFSRPTMSPNCPEGAVLRRNPEIGAYNQTF